MIIIGHRGAAGLAPENTLTSIKRAIELGVDEVEVDVRITEDGIPVLCHDRFIIEATEWRAIATHTLAEIKKFKPDIATLAEALKVAEAAPGKAALYIEVKHGEPTFPVIRLLQEHLSQARTVPGLLLGSKSQKVLRELHYALPQIPKIVIEPWSGLRAAYRARQVDTKRISMRSWWLWSGFLKRMHAHGYLITPYTMNTPRKLAAWRPYIYGVITDYPDRYVSQK